MLALTIIFVAAVVLIAAVFIVACELDRLDDRRERDARRRAERLEQTRHELADLNDGSWPAYLAEIYGAATTTDLRSAA